MANDFATAASGVLKSYGLIVLVFITLISCRSVDGGLEKCGRDVHSLARWTEVRLTNDGFCSSGRSLSCCGSWNRLVSPALDALFGRQIYVKFAELGNLLAKLEQSVTDLSCHERTSLSGSSKNDIVESLRLLREVSWSHIVNSTFSESKCGQELTKLMYCSPDYCLHEQQTAGPVNHMCRGHCTNLVKHCLKDPLDSVRNDWRQAIASLSATLKIFANKITCSSTSTQEAFKVRVDELVGELSAYRDPLFEATEVCNMERLQQCYPSMDPSFILAEDREKSGANVQGSQVKLHSVHDSLDKHLQGFSGLSSREENDDPRNVPSGSGWGMDHYTDDDEDNIFHDGGSGSGSEELPEDIPPTVVGSAPKSPEETNVVDTGDISSRKPNPSSDSTVVTTSKALFYLIAPLVLLLSRTCGCF